MPSIVAWLGYGGLIPFVGLAAGALLGGARAPSERHALLTYGAVILSFVGAVNWGIALAHADLEDSRRTRLWSWSVVPALAAWGALWLPPPLAAVVMVAGFLAQYAQDRRLVRSAAVPAWYGPLRRRLTAAACLCLLLGAASAARATPVADATSAAPARSAYRFGPASADGIGKFYAGREIAQVMGFEGAAWLERPTREQEERTDWLVDELKLVPGSTIADIGAGSGFLTRRMAPRVAPGRVFAVDVQPPMVALLDTLSRQPGLHNIVAIEGAPDDVKLAAESIDLAVMVDVYHELEYPYEVMSSLVRALKGGGRLALVEYRGEDPAVPIKALHKMSIAQIRREMAPFALDWVGSVERLPQQHIAIFRKR